MKKICCFVLGLLLVSSTAFARDIDAGSISMAGASSVSFNKLTLDAGGSDADVTITTITLNGGYFVIPNLGVGVNFAYEKLSLESTDVSLLAIGPSVTYNFSLSEQLSLFANGNVGYASAEVSSEDMTGWFLSSGGGLRFFVNDNVSLDGGLNYSYAKLQNGSDITISGLSFGVGCSVYLR